MEYLSQLLGSETPEILAFVENVGRYNRGEEVTLLETSESASNEDSKPKSTDTRTESQQVNSGNMNNKKSNKNEALHARRKQKKGRTPPPPKKAVVSASMDSSGKKPPPPKKSQLNNAVSPNEISKEEEKPVKKSHPKRGKAQIVCGCYGTKHEPLTNCLYCGRISCTREGYDFCPFCGWMIEEIESKGNSKSWVQKERLLRFDREFARRTQIFDDQADFQSPSTWMTDQERMDAEERELNRIEEMKRPKQMLSLSID